MRVYQFRHIRADGQSSHLASSRTGPERTYHAALGAPLLLTLALAVTAALALLAGGSSAASSRSSEKLVEVVVTLPRASARDGGRPQPDARGHSASGGIALAVRAPAAVSYLRTLAATQRTLAARLAVDDSGGRHPLALRRRARRRLGRPPRVRPGAPARAAGRDRLADRHVPRAARRPVDRRSAAAGIRDRTDRRHGALGSRPSQPPDRDVKIGLVDDGIDQAHPYFDPSGFSYPAGFPKGNTAYTTPKVIVARAFPSPSTNWKYANTAVRPATLLPRDARRRDRGRRLRHADRRQAASRRSRALHRRRISATTRR